MGFLTKTRDTFFNKKREGRKGGREKEREGKR